MFTLYMVSLFCFYDLAFFTVKHFRSQKITALATMLQEASLQKKDLDLELEELEAVAAMVMEEEEDNQGVPKRTLTAHSDTSRPSDSFSGSADGTSISRGGGDLSNSLHSQPSSNISPAPKDQPSTLFSTERKSGTFTSASEISEPLIQELGKNFSEELKISQEFKDKAESSYPGINNAATKTGDTLSGRTFLEINPSPNQLLVVQKQDDLCE